MVDTAKVPQYCGQCGTRLAEMNNTFVTGFDVYTGERLTSEDRSLYCPNPTIVTEGSRFNRTTRRMNHPSYSMFDGVWGQA